MQERTRRRIAALAALPLALPAGELSPQYAQASEGRRVYVSSTGPDTDSHIRVKKGEPVTVYPVDGEWTMDYRSLPYTDAKGYDAQTDKKVWNGNPDCKVKKGDTYGTLEARVGNSKKLTRVGDGVTIVPDRNGRLHFLPNDKEECRPDNDGVIVVVVTQR